MVSPLQSIAANLRPNQSPGMQIGDIISRGRQQESNLQTQALQRQNIEQQMGQRQQAMSAEQSMGAARYINSLGKQLLKTPEEMWPQMLQPHLPQLQQIGYTPEILQGMTKDQVAAVVAQTEPLVGAPGQTAGERDLEAKARAIVGATNPDTGEPFTLEEARKAVALRETGIVARASESAEERIAKDVELTNKVADSKSKIRKSIKLAEQLATTQGETITDYNRAKAALPGLQEVVGNLRELAPIATSTLGGRVFDLASKEAGFGSTKGANARAKFIAIIDNQILPLLKQTFGAAFTVQEGERLRATLGDPDASPSEKMEQLDAFIDAKMRELETKERELGLQGVPVDPSQPSEPSVQLSDEELFSKYGLSP